MNTLKFMLSFVVCCTLLQTTTAQKISSSSSVSQKIANGASDTEILKSWENLVLQKQIRTYPDAEKLLDQTMQLAFLHGNRQLGASITKTSYYNTLTTTLEEEITAVKVTMQKGGQVNFVQKNYKLQPDARDMQRLAGIGKIDLASQRQLRLNLIEKAHEILIYVPGFQTAKGQKTSAKQQQVKPSEIFTSTDIVLSNGKTFTTKEALNVYLDRLVTAKETANNVLQKSSTQLQGITLMQQKVVQKRLL